MKYRDETIDARFEAWRDAAEKAEVPVTLMIPREVLDWVGRFTADKERTIAGFLADHLNWEYFDQMRPDLTDEEKDALGLKRQRDAEDMPF